jgi:hypothetical protein
LVKLTEFKPYGFKATFNPTCPGKSSTRNGWVSPWYYGLNQGPIVLMIENDRTGLLWQLMRNGPYMASGLRRAGVGSEPCAFAALARSRRWVVWALGITPNLIPA